MSCRLPPKCLVYTGLLSASACESEPSCCSVPGGAGWVSVAAGCVKISVGSSQLSAHGKKSKTGKPRGIYCKLPLGIYILKNRLNKLDFIMFVTN